MYSIYNFCIYQIEIVYTQGCTQGLETQRSKFPDFFPMFIYSVNWAIGFSADFTLQNSGLNVISMPSTTSPEI